MAQETVGIRELKAGLSSYIRQVKSGAPVIITDRGEPVARLVPMGGSVEDRMEGLVEADVDGVPLVDTNRDVREFAVLEGPD